MKTQIARIVAALLYAMPAIGFCAADNLLGEVVVTASRIEQPLSQSLTHTTVIDRQDILDSQAVDVAGLLKDLAGVEFYRSGGIGQQASLFVRGTNSSHVLVLLDGVRINSATTGTTEIDQLMLDQVERIEVVRGNVSSLYGSEAVGGVIQIFTRRGKGEPSFNASGGAGTQDTTRASADFGGAADNTIFNVLISRFRTAGVSAINPRIVPMVNPDSDGYDNTSLSANLGYAFNNDHSLSASLFDSHGAAQTDNSFGLPSDVNSSRSHIRKLALMSDHSIGKIWHSKLQWSQGMDDMQNFLNGAPDEVFGALFRTTNIQLSWQNELRLDEHHSLNIGVETLVQQVTSSTRFSANRRRVNSMFAGYSGSNGLHNWQLDVRQDRYSDFGVSGTGMLGYGFALSDALRLSIAAGTAFKAPTINDLYYPYTDYGGGFSYQGNPGLKPERSRNLELGAHYTSPGQLLDVAYFDGRISDMISSNGLPANTTVNLDQARSNGFEFSYAGRFGGTGIKAALTLQDPRDVISGWALLRRAKRYGNLAASRSAGAWRLGGEIQFSGPRDDIDINTFARTTLAGYGVIDLSARYAFDRHLGFSMKIDNLFDRSYMLAHGYNTAGRALFAAMECRY